jgi:hypothetical protein
MSLLILNTTLRPALAVVSAVAFLLCLGCQEVWYLSIADTRDISAPTYCVSSKPECKGAPIDLKTFVVEQVDEKGEAVGTVWGMQVRDTNRPVMEVRHGKSPEGWTTFKEAKPLQAGKYYRIADQYVTCFVASQKAECKVSRNIGDIVARR